MHPWRGFALPAVLVVVAALLILAVGILVVSGIERRTARSYVDLQRADLAARAGLEDLRATLDRETANDDYIVLQAQPSDPAGEDPAYLFLARGRPDGSAGYRFRYRPLFSATAGDPPESAILRAPDVEDFRGDREALKVFTTLPYLAPVEVAWVPVEDDAGRVVARYAWWAEDLQGRLDPRLTGNSAGPAGDHVRAPWPFPAAGVNPDLPGEHEPGLDQVALYAVEPESTPADQGKLAVNLHAGRDLLVSPDSLLAAAGVAPPLERDETGRLQDESAHAIERNLVAGVQPYFEMPVVPPLDGIDPSAAGLPKRNLNALLRHGAAAVDEMAGLIDRALPDFAGTRRGGFPEDYLRTLAANAIDYADDDPAATLAPGSHRGLDAYPVVSEFLMRFEWSGVTRESGRVYLELTVSTFVELWNMSDQPIEGSAEMTYETKYQFQVGAIPEIRLDDLAEATHSLNRRDGKWWFPPLRSRDEPEARTITLGPNAQRVFKCGSVRYKFDVGPSSFFLPSPITLSGEIYGTSGAGYELRWNGQVIDRSRGGLHRNDANLHYPRGINRPNVATRATIPSHSHTRFGTYMNNMGDPRMSYYNQAPQDANAYPGNYSPNRRTVRWESVYKIDGATKAKIHGRVLPSEWPDGGHNAIYGSNAFATTDVLVEPDDERFFLGIAEPRREEAPLRLSDRGRFYSATELGRVYDPIMWRVVEPRAANEPWGDVTAGTLRSTDHGGGNTLRIGRPEHPRFAASPGTHAVRLLDLFHAGQSRSENEASREGPLVRIEGHVNLNTASRDALRALVAGPLVMDPLLSRRTSDNHETNFRMAPPTVALDEAARELPADRIADAIIHARPFVSPSQLAEVMDRDGEPVFGNRGLFSTTKVHWTDSAAEEMFARAYEASTVRSRNFRVWVIGQALAPASSDDVAPQVLAETRKVFTVFADPGERSQNGQIESPVIRTRVLYENDF